MNSTHRKTLLPYGRQSIEDSDLDAVCKALKSDFLTTGPIVEEFEEAFKSVTGSGHVCVVNSGTAALHLANLALGVRASDVVIAPALTFAATANAVRLCGAEVVFADADPKTGLVTTKTLEAAVLEVKKIYGKLPVGAWITHYAGQMPRMDELAQIANKFGFWLGEDACHAVATEYDFDGLAGTVGDCRWSRATVFSFHPVKTFTTGEGGAIATNCPRLDRKVKQLRSHGISRDVNEIAENPLAFADTEKVLNPWFYDMVDLGLNYRLPDILCALGLSQLKRLNQFIDRRKALSRIYDSSFFSAHPCLRPLDRIEGVSPVWHLYVLLIDFHKIGMNRAEFMDKLKQKGILSQVHYIPSPLLRYYQERYGRERMSSVHFPGATEFYDVCISLPLFPEMKDTDAVFVAETVLGIVGEAVADAR